MLCLATWRAASACAVAAAWLGRLAWLQSWVKEHRLQGDLVFNSLAGATPMVLPALAKTTMVTTRGTVASYDPWKEEEWGRDCPMQMLAAHEGQSTPETE
ncbi:hypothetical protein MRX96_006497 [Rhipicephalus microplus]